MLAALDLLRAPQTDDPWQALAHWRHWSPDRHQITLGHGGVALSGHLSALPKGRWQMDLNGAQTEFGVQRLDDDFVLQQGDLRFTVSVVLGPAQVTIFAHGRGHDFTLPVPISASDHATHDNRVLAPMPGLVKMVAFAAGQRVAKGQALIVLEAMKMEHTLTAPANGVVAEVLVSAGDQVSDGTLLLRLELDDA